MSSPADSKKTVPFLDFSDVPFDSLQLAAPRDGRIPGHSGLLAQLVRLRFGPGLNRGELLGAGLPPPPRAVGDTQQSSSSRARPCAST